MFNFFITTPNPTGIVGPFFTYAHAYCTYDVFTANNISLLNNGYIGTANQSVNVKFTPTYVLQIQKSSDSSVIFTSPVFAGAAAVTIAGSIDLLNNGYKGIANQTINITGGNGTNVVFATVNLEKNTQYKFRILVKASSWTYTNVSTANVAPVTFSVRAVQKAIYVQSLLR